MAEISDSIDKYLTGNYELTHPDWHAGDAFLKAADIKEPVQSVIDELSAQGGLREFRIADVGAGVGLVLKELKAQLTISPEVRWSPTAYEISPHAAKLARDLNPELPLIQRALKPNEASYDVALLVDVLEHVENPWELLRTVRSNAQYLVVRQPLLGNFSRFRHNNYKLQRDQWGHISLFNYFSFLDMAKACGWNPFRLELAAPWELASAGPKRTPFAGWILTKFNRPFASFLIDGFYLNGAFRRH